MLKRNMKQRTGRSEQGLTLIEVLVALLVLSIGMLGLAALQASGLSFNHDSYMRTQATTLAYDVIERMRIDRDKAVNGDFNDAYTPADAGTTCDASSSTVADAILCWRVELRDNLMGGSLSISQAVAPNTDQFTVAISWTDKWRQAGATASNSSQSWTFEL